ncbi:MAG: hypothetical protein HS126_33545 [Anaerolineales bacterium]|nr:hypothetical protein [Anaerolineales bacterium]
MMELYLKSLLGGWGSAILDFMLDQPSVVAGLLLVWFAIFVAGRLQLRRIEQKSAELVVTMARELLVTQPDLTPEGLYEQVYEPWRARVSQWALFIPHRLDLWPVPVTAKTVQQKLAFSPDWLVEVLRRHGLLLEKSERVAHVK